MHKLIVPLAVLFLLAVPLSAQTPDELWHSLMEGNKVYVAGTVTFDKLAELRHETAANQHPPVTVLSCADSRVPQELIFNRSLDQLFVIRVAGNVASEFDIASIEYAIAHDWTKLIVVMGHEECGAVRAALSTTPPGTPALEALVHRIRESLHGIPRKVDPATVKRAVEANARGSAAYLLAHSKVIADAVHSGRVGLVVAYYSMTDGTISRIAN